MKLPLVTSYSNLQLRLGYLKIIAAVGSRAPTTLEAFERKLAPLFPHPPKKASPLAKTSAPLPKAYVQQLFTGSLVHEKGLLNQHNISEIITLAKAFTFLNPTNCSLFEIASVLRAIMSNAAVRTITEADVKSGYNPLILDQDGNSHTERGFFLVLALTTDLPIALAACVAAESAQPFRLFRGFPAKGELLVEGENAVHTAPKTPIKKKPDDGLTPYSQNNILLDSYALIRDKAANQLSITNWREWKAYFEGDEPQSPFEKRKFFRMGKRSSFRHHAAPRLEFLVDLGLLDLHTPEPGQEDSDYHYVPNGRTRRFAGFLQENLLSAREIQPDKFVRTMAMKCLGETYSLTLRDATPDETMQFLLRSYQTVKRDIGTTPMWTTALMGSLLALDAGIRLEIESLYNIARQKAQEERAQIRLSGGSRFDGEFLIGIAPELLKPLPPKAS